MASHIVTPGSIRCGHLDDVDQKKCGHDQPCRLGVQPFQIITKNCKRCMQDPHNRLHHNFHDLEDKLSLLRYWYCRKLSEDRYFWGPSRMGVGVDIPVFKSIGAEMEKRMRETWQEESRRFIKLASCGASAVFMNDQEPCSVDELDSDKGRALLERAMEMILEEMKMPKELSSK